MYLGQEFFIFGNWFIIHFTENEGMAFGMKFGGEFGKLALSLFRIIAIIAIGWYLHDLAKKRTSFGLILCISLILAGAIGNMLDSAFYGILFSDSIYQVATFLPEGGGSDSFLHGKVVDMFYFPIIEGYFPKWVPIWGSEKFIFFRPVFNIADSSLPQWVKGRLLKMSDHHITPHGDIIIKSQENRSLIRNKESALERLKELIVKATIIPKKRKATKPTKSSVRKRLDSKKVRGRVKKSRGRVDIP